ncbi:MAG: SpoIIE family protein phosphatase [Bacteroidales bacterium]|nr:SpoIIE family protein phosphatase [Bacteroidales bacterium]MBN2756684.1 SpoIIE family protein phosphatase [Bacteroidales bacterium]
MNKNFTILLIVFIIFFTSSCKDKIDFILFDNAHLDISDKSIEKYGIYDLNGQWEFYPNKLFTPADFVEKEKITKNFEFVPELWNNYSDFDSNPINFATYRLIIKKHKTDSVFGLRINKINSAYKIWVNGKIIEEVGVVGDTQKKTKPIRFASANFFRTYSEQIEIVIQVSNFCHNKGGIVKSIQLAASENLIKSENKRLAIDFFFFGLMLIIGFYHIVLFMLRRDVYSSLFFALLTLSAAVHLAVGGDFKIINLIYQDLSWNLQLRLDFLFYYFIFLFFALFIVSMFKQEASKLFVWVIYGFIGIMSLVVIFTKPLIFTSTLFIFELFIVIAIVYLMFVIIKSSVKQVEGAKHTLLGAFVLAAAIVYDILNQQMLISSNEIVPYALVLFILIESYLISSRFSKAYLYSEELTQELDYVNNNLEQLVKERTLVVEAQKEELSNKSKSLQIANNEIGKINEILEEQSEDINKKNKALTDSLNYAKRLQEAVLPDENYLKERLPEHFIYFNPKDIVSGDFYWYGEVESSWDFDEANSLKILIAADCTGHGVPGAFMTLLGNNFLHLIVNIQEVVDPEQILYKLDQLVIETLKQRESGTMKDGMDIAVIILDEEKKIISFAGAGNPLFYIRNNELIELRGSNFGIGGVLRKEKIFEPYKVQYEEGDVFYIFSDGYFDQIGGGEGRKFYKKRFKELLLKIHTMPLDEQKERLSTVFERWKSDKKQIDDVLVIGLKT